ncbi:MAG: hypothetical protein EWV48_17985 [Microcystis aeruginosa Ma_QC_C_20070823_S13]|nr:MAG: hypothetical protein EWV48_17985 [Microcystis aeruginosa Ma_QC_C_20070823_S13]
MSISRFHKQKLSHKVEKSRDRRQETGDYFYLFFPLPHVPTSPRPHVPTSPRPHFPTPHCLLFTVY